MYLVIRVWPFGGRMHSNRACERFKRFSTRPGWCWWREWRGRAFRSRIKGFRKFFAFEPKTFPSDGSPPSFLARVKYLFDCVTRNSFRTGCVANFFRQEKRVRPCPGNLLNIFVDDIFSGEKNTAGRAPSPGAARAPCAQEFRIIISTVQNIRTLRNISHGDNRAAGKKKK